MNDLEQGVENIIRMITRDAPLEVIANEIASMFGYPASILDEAFNILAMSEDFYRLLPEFGDDEGQGYINTDVQQELSSSTITRPLGVRDRPAKYQVKLADGKVINNYFNLIYVNTIVIGSFSVFVRDAELDRDQLNAMPTIARLLSLGMRERGANTLTKSSNITKLLRSLASPASLIHLDEEDARQRFSVFGYDLRKYKHVTFFDMSESGVSWRIAQQMANQFRKDTGERAVFYLEDTDIVMLNSHNEQIDPGRLKSDAVSAWERTAGGDISIRAGFSDSFTDVRDFGRAIDQAKSAIAIGRRMDPQSTVYVYDDYRTFDLFRHLEHGSKLADFYYPPLLKVIQHDAENGTDLAKTLFAYISDPEHAHAVSEKLGVHRNTLYYRLNRIEELMGKDSTGEGFRSAQSFGQIYLTFAMLLYEGKISLD